MSKKPRSKPVRQFDTPVVAEVRRARRRLAREAGGELAEYLAQAREFAARLRRTPELPKPRGRKR